MTTAPGESQRFVVEVLRALDREGGAVSKKRLQQIVRHLRPGDRDDLNYGRWVAKDKSRVIRLVDGSGTDGPDADPMMVMTESGRQLLRDAGFAPTSVPSEEREDETARDVFEHDTGESFDDYLGRKMSDPRE